MLKSFNETHHPALFAAARTAGAGVGAMVRERGWVAADMTIRRASVAWVARLPLDNLKLEVELQEAYIVAAHVAATAPAPWTVGDRVYSVARPEDTGTVIGVATDPARCMVKWDKDLARTDLEWFARGGHAMTSWVPDAELEAYTRPPCEYCSSIEAMTGTHHCPIHQAVTNA